MSVEAALAVIRARAPRVAPRVGLILGSGLDGLAREIEDATEIPYGDIPGFPELTVDGHAGRLVLGRLGGRAIACLRGRAHLYEGGRDDAMAVPVHALSRLGCEILVLTNAAGGLREEMAPGALMLVADHINFTGRNPLLGPNDPTLGPRFPDMTVAYDLELRHALRRAAGAEGVWLHEGVYLCCLGPNFETPAEIHAFASLGADAVGMSTVPECLLARHVGLRVAALSTITNLAAGMSGEPIDHDGTLGVGAAAAGDLARVLRRFLAGLGGGAS